MQTFFADSPAMPGATTHLSGDEYRHAARSCRVRVGEVVRLMDGHGWRAEAEVAAVDATTLTACVVRDLSGVGEPARFVSVALALIRPARFETAVEKCTELGVRRIILLAAQRCEHAPGRFSPDRLARIAREAAKQSGRSWVPGITGPTAIDDVLADADGLVLTAAIGADESLAARLEREQADAPVTVLVGPEGDFTSDERERMTAHGVVAVSLGGLVLRAETAAIAAAVMAVSG